MGYLLASLPQKGAQAAAPRRMSLPRRRCPCRGRKGRVRRRLPLRLGPRLARCTRAHPRRGARRSEAHAEAVRGKGSGRAEHTGAAAAPPAASQQRPRLPPAHLPHAALAGSSHYVLPRPLRWLSANIGIHHVHHLYSRIPFYRLPEILRDHADLAVAQRLTLGESLRSVNLHLWDNKLKRLISFSEARRRCRAA